LGYVGFEGFSSGEVVVNTVLCVFLIGEEEGGGLNVGEVGEDQSVAEVVIPRVCEKLYVFAST
jgi:hypothetical protein